jgi:hypothetical protein
LQIYIKRFQMTKLSIQALIMRKLKNVYSKNLGACTYENHFENELECLIDNMSLFPQELQKSVSYL